MLVVCFLIEIITIDLSNFGALIISDTCKTFSYYSSLEYLDKSNFNNFIKSSMFSKISKIKYINIYHSKNGMLKTANADTYLKKKNTLVIYQI